MEKPDFKKDYVINSLRITFEDRVTGQFEQGLIHGAIERLLKERFAIKVNEIKFNQ